MPTLRLDADARKGVKAFQDLDKAIEEAGKELDTATKRADKFDKAAQRIKESIDPQQRYNRQIKELGTLVDKNKLSYDQAQAKAQQLAQRLQNVGSAGKTAFDPGLLANYAAGFSGPMAAGRMFLSLLQTVRSEQQAIAQGQMTDAESRGQLVQLAGGDRAKRDRLFAASDRTFNEGFVRDRTAANRLAFELDSAGLIKDREFYSQLSLIDDSAVLAKSTGLIQSGFAGGDAVGDSRSVISKAIAGALPATGVSPAQIAEGVAIASASAKGFGLSDEETFAAVSRIAQTTGSGSEAGNRLKALLSSLSRQGLADELKGQGLQAIIGNVQGRGLSQEGLTKFLGSSEAAQGFDVLTDREALFARIGEINAAQRDNLAGQTIANAIENRSLAATVLRRRGAAVRVLAQEEMAIAENMAAADRDAAYAQEVMSGNTGRAAMNDWSRQKVDYWLGPGGGEQALGELIAETRETNTILRNQTSGTTKQE